MNYRNTTFRAAVFLVALSICTPANADAAARIAEILARDVFRDDGTLASERIASVEACVVRISLNYGDACEKGIGPRNHETYIDLRVLEADKENASIKDLTGTDYEKLGATVRYPYRPRYSLRLAAANKAYGVILTEGYAKYPDDVSLRLQWLDERIRENIDLQTYSKSNATATFCSGLESSSPLPESYFIFSVRPEHAAELATLLDEYASEGEVNNNS